MEIERIELDHLRMKLRSPFETSFGRIETRDCILVSVHAGGVVGYGECAADADPWYSYEDCETAWHILRDYLAPDMLSNPVGDPLNCFSQFSVIKGHNMAKAGLEMAIWDLVGKQKHQSLKTMLGGEKDRVPVGVSVGIQKSPEVLLETVAGYLAQGYRRVKIKIKPGRDVGDAETVRQAYPDLKLQVDANSAYTLESAGALKGLDELDLLLIEQPLAEDDLWDHAKLQKEFSTPICLDESITSLRHTRHALEMQSCRIVNIKAGRVGGLGQAAAIHDLCRQQGVPVWCGGMLETGVGRASNLALASLPNFVLPGDISASDRYYEEDITEELFTLNDDSTINVPEGAGLGVKLRQDVVKKVAVKSEVIHKN